MRAAIFAVLALASILTAALVVHNARAARGFHCGCPAAKTECSEPCNGCCAPGPCPMGNPSCKH